MHQILFICSLFREFMKILLSSIYPYAFAALFLILPFDEYVRALPNILMILLVVAFPYVIEKEDFSRIKKTPFFLLCGFALFLVVNTLLLERSQENFSVVNKVLIGLVLFILYLPVRDIKKIKNAIIFSALAAILFSLYSVVLMINEAGIFNVGNPLRSSETLIVDRLYLGFLSVCSILISYSSMTKTFNEYNKYHLANIILNTLFALFIVSRYAVATLLIILIVTQFYGKKKTLKITIIAIALALISFISYQLKDTVTKRFLYAEDYTTNPKLVKDQNSFDQREKIWSCVANIAQEEGILFSGLSFQGTKDALQNCYAYEISDQETKTWFLKKRYNTHNQFIDFYLSMGIIALGLIMSFFLYTFFKNRSDFVKTTFLLSMFSLGMIENFFHRQIGAYYFGFILIMVLINHNSFSNNKISEKTSN
jgi:O-antigen ligase